MSEVLQASNLKSLRFQSSKFFLYKDYGRNKEIQTCEKQVTYNYATLENRLMSQIWDSSSE